ncbi:hypothetical protein P0W64_21240 [Tsukamurella sp. 8F]|uniref:hypothetical protein n=1 Tax=unclassified Tsukamurella TaxID=2633480 RepID=UPI0023B8DAEC|nr:MULTISPECIES: hypothetical protein [unclassified Tsukamurella]MDF0532283.1 hypothetical protein [Tsukamurella sp. 8J]MDF0589309.1 hypothetical protein [Tsukamurella sp. 8F]
MSSYSKVSMNLSDEVLGAARDIAERDHVTLTEVFRRSISTQVFLEDAQREGKSVMLRDEKSGTLERVHFR